MQFLGTRVVYFICCIWKYCWNIYWFGRFINNTRSVLFFFFAAMVVCGCWSYCSVWDFSHVFVNDFFHGFFWGHVDKAYRYFTHHCPGLTTSFTHTPDAVSVTEISPCFSLFPQSICILYVPDKSTFNSICCFLYAMLIIIL